MRSVLTFRDDALDLHELAEERREELARRQTVEAEAAERSAASVSPSFSLTRRWRENSRLPAARGPAAQVLTCR